jgi:polyferredoxin
MAAAEGVVAGCAVVFFAQFVGSMVLGRLFCGWMCAAAGLQSACTTISDKRANNRLNWAKYAIWIPWMGLIVMAAFASGGFRAVELLYETQYGVSVAEPAAYVVYFIVTGVIVVLALTAGKHGFCHYGCWMAPFMIIGTGVSDRLRLWRLRLRADKDKCIECRRCEKACPMSLEVMKMVRGDAMDDSECVLCGSCVDNCGVGAIQYRFGRPGKKST